MNTFEIVPLINLNIVFLYTSHDNELEKITKERVTLNNKNVLSKEEMLYIIKKHICPNNVKYRLLSIMLYNLDIMEDELDDYIATPSDESYMTLYKTICDVRLNETLNVFDDLNTLFIVFYRYTPSMNTTKKVYIKSQGNKTHRKPLKEIRL